MKGPYRRGGGGVPSGGRGQAGPVRKRAASPRELYRALTPLGRRRALLGVVLLTGVMGLGIVFMSAFSMWWTSQPSFCNRCHPMKPFVAGWSAAPHRDVTCEQCHVAPGFFGFVGGKIAGLQVVANYARGRFEDYSFNAVVANPNCLQCHQDILDGNIRKDGIIVSHKNIVENGGKCIFCHSTVGHGDAVPVGAQTFPTMQSCLQCHNGVTAPFRCTICHAKSVPSGAPPAPPQMATTVHPSIPIPTPATPAVSPAGGGS